ncbi:PAS domain-containing protein [Streptococcus minor]|uniref:histidine kinase n=1 Tax=Streptococcus minor TaxID=229549 RepID=A0A3P1VAG0_9STRE|nr:ATP-binding protein [Streptococcus minor]RRD31214.1 PAS domain-containing protein [Streptococcus minor]
MIKKIFRSTLFSNFMVLLASLTLIMGVLYKYFTQVQIEQLQTQTALVAKGLSAEGQDYFDGLKTAGIRITWLDNTGMVLYDSKYDAKIMENHGERQEIKDALETGYGESRRYSSTLTQTSLYIAQRLDNGTVVRLSVAQHSVVLLLLGILPMLLLIAVVVVALSILVAKYTAKRLVQPLNQLNLDAPLENPAYEEISPLLRRIDHQQKELASQEQLLLQRKGEFETIISKIREGMVLLDNYGQIISMNPAAQSLLQTDADSIGKEILELVRNLQLHQLIQSGLKGDKGEGVFAMEQMTYKVLVRPVLSEEQVSGLVLLFFDVTEQWQVEQMRREFTANVSHELKTPLHIISGYSEMLRSQFVSDGDVQVFAQKIHTEAQRMVQLVEDVIHLSLLDETPQIIMEEVDLYQLASESLESLSGKASQKQIDLHLKGEATSLEGNRALLSSVIYNLCDNAITYNHPKGDVFVTIEKTDQDIILEIKDTGIGIPKEEEDRIFERFYRVDKSRSKKVGGTGLGLSIVKHALKCHGATIQVDSQVNQGTAMTVIFPREK